MNHRPDRVGQLIRDELSVLVAKELEFPSMLVTLVDVTVNKKLDIADVFVSVWPQEARKTALTILRAAQPRLQWLLLQRFRIKPMPRIEFKLDKGNENAADVEKALLQNE